MPVTAELPFTEVCAAAAGDNGSKEADGKRWMVCTGCCEPLLIECVQRALV